MTLSKHFTLHVFLTVIFALVALIHGIRLWFGYTVTFGPFSLPLWISWTAVVLAVISGLLLFFSAWKS